MNSRPRAGEHGVEDDGVAIAAQVDSIAKLRAYNLVVDHRIVVVGLVSVRGDGNTGLGEGNGISANRYVTGIEDENAGARSRGGIAVKDVVCHGVVFHQSRGAKSELDSILCDSDRPRTHH